MPSSTINIRVDDSKREGLDALAKATGRSRNFLVGEAIARYLEDEAWQIGKIMQGLKEADEGLGADQEEVDAEMREIIAVARVGKTDRMAAV